LKANIYTYSKNELINKLNKFWYILKNQHARKKIKPTFIL